MNNVQLKIISSATPIADGRLWFSQVQIAAIFNKNLRTINEHTTAIKSLKPDGIMRIGITQTEGARQIRRTIIHYDLDFVHTIGIASREYDRLDSLLTECKHAGFRADSYDVVPKREREFFQMVNDCFSGVCEFVPQYRVGQYRIDLYSADMKLAIEYDEVHHRKPYQVRLDRLRESAIVKLLGATTFIRVNEGSEFSGLNLIIKFILRGRLNRLRINGLPRPHEVVASAQREKTGGFPRGKGRG